MMNINDLEIGGNIKNYCIYKMPLNFTGLSLQLLRKKYGDRFDKLIVAATEGCANSIELLSVSYEDQEILRT